MNCFLVLSLAVLGASAAPCLNTVSVGCAGALPGRNIFTQTPVIEYPTRVIPSCLPQASVCQSCHCLKTIVRPQIRNEVISVPEVDRIVRVVPSPVVEVSTVNVGGNIRNTHIPTCGVTGVVGGYNTGIVGGCTTGLIGGCNTGIVGGCTTGLVGGCNTGIVGTIGGCTTGLVGGCNTGIVGGCNTGIVGGCNTGIIGGCNTGIVGTVAC